ncbi:hypothetical protein [Actinopolyspora mortivallis]|uniref:hypothetical protein n=1 Tax=Actinopolyspora mortivallis TaxID=33906 RepID=UPI0011B2046A|nr:hypothetical protein [Actinopolyspora mortivallis]
MNHGEVDMLARRILHGLARTWLDQQELHERLIVTTRPWECRFLHWSWEEGDWTLHGNITPPDRTRRATTRRGWCCCSRLRSARN